MFSTNLLFFYSLFFPASLHLSRDQVGNSGRKRYYQVSTSSPGLLLFSTSKSESKGEKELSFFFEFDQVQGSPN